MVIPSARRAGRSGRNRCRTMPAAPGALPRGRGSEPILCLFRTATGRGVSSEYVTELLNRDAESLAWLFPRRAEPVDPDVIDVERCRQRPAHSLAVVVRNRFFAFSEPRPAGAFLLNTSPNF